jgi:hypothetical protein
MFGFVAASGWVTAQVEICAGLVWIFVCLDARITWSLLACTARRGAREPSGWAPVQGRGEIDLAQTCLTRGDAERMHHQVRGLLKEYQ